MSRYWNPGDVVAWRWIANDRLRVVAPYIVVKDSAEETVLLLPPGSNCMVPDQLWREGTYEEGRSKRWVEERTGEYTLREHIWAANRLLMVVEPGKFYSIIHFWRHETNTFSNYYVNFQLPFQRSHCGFDSYDLELDLVVEPMFEWEWKDTETYQEGVAQGNIRPEWVGAIEQAQPEIFARLNNRVYPFDGHWRNFQPNLNWEIPTLPDHWDRLD